MIKELKNYSEHLENFKFVLNSKIKALNEEKEPMEDQVKTLEGHIRNIYNELAEETTKNKNLQIKLKDSESKYLCMRDEIRKSKNTLTKLYRSSKGRPSYICKEKNRNDAV